MLRHVLRQILATPRRPLCRGEHDLWDRDGGADRWLCHVDVPGHARRDDPVRCRPSAGLPGRADTVRQPAIGECADDAGADRCCAGDREGPARDQGCHAAGRGIGDGDQRLQLAGGRDDGGGPRPERAYQRRVAQRGRAGAVCRRCQRHHPGRGAGRCAWLCARGYGDVVGHHGRRCVERRGSGADRHGHHRCSGSGCAAGAGHPAHGAYISDDRRHHSHRSSAGGDRHNECHGGCAVGRIAGGNSRARLAPSRSPSCCLSPWPSPTPSRSAW